MSNEYIIQPANDAKVEEKKQENQEKLNGFRGIHNEKISTET